VILTDLESAKRIGKAIEDLGYDPPIIGGQNQYDKVRLCVEDLGKLIKAKDDRIKYLENELKEVNKDAIGLFNQITNVNLPSN
jgi:hypothetical protein